MAKHPPRPEEALLVPPARLESLPRLTGPLLAWYREHARPLPWRENPSPYGVWVSEIMLQQTRVEAVKEYYRRFLTALPTVADLAAARLDQVLKLWEGLGYYSRARNLHRAAGLVMERHGGVLPASYAELRALPGIGEYTGGAVASIAFGIPVPAVDGNVYRVLSRILASCGDTSQAAVKAAFRTAAASMLPEEAPGDFNQALMELGATVCLPGARPLCGRCPVADDCAAAGPAAAELPVKAKKTARRIEERTIVLVLSRRGLLLFRRKDRGLLARLYEPLNLEGRLDETEAVRAVEALGGRAESAAPLAPAKHIFSHVEWRMTGYLVRTPPFEAAEGLWADRDALRREYALPGAFNAYLREMDHQL